MKTSDFKSWLIKKDLFVIPKDFVETAFVEVVETIQVDGEELLLVKGKPEDSPVFLGSNVKRVWGHGFRVSWKTQDLLSTNGEICVFSKLPDVLKEIWQCPKHNGKYGPTAVAIFEGTASAHFSDDAWSSYCRFTGRRFAKQGEVLKLIDEAWINPTTSRLVGIVASSREYADLFQELMGIPVEEISSESLEAILA